MLFSSWQFLFLFLPVALIVFFFIPAHAARPRKIWLLAASLFFYGYWKIEYIPLLLFSIGGNYTVAELITRHRHRRAAKGVFIIGISLNLLLLGYYKYTNFILPWPSPFLPSPKSATWWMSIATNRCITAFWITPCSSFFSRI